MKIDVNQLLVLWYQNAEGEKWVPDLTLGECPTPPPGFIYQMSRFPGMVRERMLRGVQREEVETCEHPEGLVVPTFGWIEGMVGRECKKCHGTQLKKKEESWPEEWDASGCRVMAESETTWSEELVMAMVTSGDYGLKQAILIAVTACERCMNVLAHQYGLEDGYPEGSEQWEKSRTICQFCEGETYGTVERDGTKEGGADLSEVEGSPVSERAGREGSDGGDESPRRD